jgi:hypothetical protein
MIEAVTKKLRKGWSISKQAEQSKAHVSPYAETAGKSRMNKESVVKHFVSSVQFDKS